MWLFGAMRSQYTHAVLNVYIAQPGTHFTQMPKRFDEAVCVLAVVDQRAGEWRSTFFARKPHTPCDEADDGRISC